MLEVRDLSKSYGAVQALKNVSLTVRSGETVALVGGSGCGKSTLARILVGLVVPDAGQVTWEGKDLLTMTRADRASRLQMIFQDPYASLNPKLTVGIQLMEAMRHEPEALSSDKKHSWFKAQGSRLNSLLESVGLSVDSASHYPFQFSGGQRQRIAIARALALHPKLLIADEPLSALDVETQSQILRLFRDLKAQFGLTLIFITHDLSIAAAFADRMVVMESGQIVEEGTAAQTLRNPKHSYTRALVDAILPSPE